MSFRRFVRRMRMRSRNVPGEVGRVMRKAALAADQTVVVATPVDTGRARSDWRASIGTELTSSDPGHVGPTGKGGANGPIATQAALAQAQGVIRGHRDTVPIFITNNVRYIGDLNQGTSSQAPAGFVQMAVQQGVAAVRGARVDTRRRGR